MADNTTLNTGTGGDVIATDDIAGVKHQRVKVEFGADGSASDVSFTNPLPTSAGASTTGTLSSVAGTVSASTTLLALNAARLRATFYNDSTAVLYLSLNATCTTSSYTVQIPANGYYELPANITYTGIVTGTWATATGNVRVTELTA